MIEAQISLTGVVNCDIGRISQLLSNLVANALACRHVMLRSKCEPGITRLKQGNCKTKRAQTSRKVAPQADPYGPEDHNWVKGPSFAAPLPALVIA